jgi:ABC-2 type transport system ATP-binding protein
MALAIEPEILMLDDPATGLDPAARRSLLEAMVYFTRDRERTIFFSTHLLDDVERVADFVAVMDYSVLRVCCCADTFRERVRRLVARFPGQPPRDLPPIPGLLRASRTENQLSLIVANLSGRTEHDLERLGALSIDEQPMSLEDALIAHVGRQGDKSFFLSAAGDTP